MSQTEATRQADWIWPPTVQTDGKSTVIACAVTTTAGFLDLAAVPMPSNSPNVVETPNVIGQYITLTADQGDVYVIFGPSQASVTGANAPLPTSVSTISGAGVPTLAVQICDYLPAGTKRDFKIPLGAQSPAGRGKNSPARFLAFVTRAGTATLRVTLSSPPER